eukprot:TRINITY_DN23339_c0_g1_i3.p1 TRINITY_DN23339_c0_g1~~TRINITY_DN23339_c0_g1_i3.p1  ORF type:complete len:352 (-),score=95.64 TRINITY_DN23339_c0_g1_i3:340-1395(-)
MAPTAAVEWLGSGGPAASQDAQAESTADAAAALKSRRVNGSVLVRHGMLFFAGQKLCSLRSDLLAPPDRPAPLEVSLRLVGGRQAIVAFQGEAAAKAFLGECSAVWAKAAEAKGFAGAARRLEAERQRRLEREATAAASAPAAGADALESSSRRSRSRSRSGEGAVRPSRKRLLQRLNSVEAEGVYRLQHAEDLSQERERLQESQREHVVVEHLRRGAMTREELVESLRKEAALALKIGEVRDQERRERECFDSLRREEALLHASLKEADRGDGEADDGSGAATAATSEPVDDAARAASTVCVICMSALRRIVFLPCKHQVCCADCGQGARAPSTCPLCRAEVHWRFKVFL